MIYFTLEMKNYMLFLMVFMGLALASGNVFAQSNQDNRSTYNAPTSTSDSAYQGGSSIYSSKARTGGGTSSYTSSSRPIFLDNGSSNAVTSYSASKPQPYGTSSGAYSKSRQQLLAERSRLNAEYEQQLAERQADYQQRQMARQQYLMQLAGQTGMSDENLVKALSKDDKKSSYNMSKSQEDVKKKKRVLYNKGSDLETPPRVFNSVR
jgi:hypothetical protein